MTDRSEPVVPSTEGSIEPDKSPTTAPNLANEVDAVRRTLSASALAAAVAAVTLPLLKIRKGDAQTLLSCPAEGFTSVDIGDMPQLRDSCFAALPNDCYTLDSSGKYHFYDSGYGGEDWSGGGGGSNGDTNCSDIVKEMNHACGDDYYGE